MFSKVKEKILSIFNPIWIEIESETEIWNVEYNFPLIGTKLITRKCTFKILFSSKLNKYKLVCKGYHPLEHTKSKKYINRVQYLNEMKKLIK